MAARGFFVGGWMKLQYEPHEKGYPLYVSEHQRVCTNCPDGANILPVQKFYKNKQGVSVVCRQCALDHEQDVVSLATASQISKGLASARSDGGTSGASYAEVLQAICSPMGGTKKAMRKVGRVFKTTLNKGVKPNASANELNMAVKIGSILLQSAAVQEKNNKPADPQSYSEEFIIEQCIDLMITNAGMRKRVLNDPSVRRVILNDLGVTVVEMERDDGAEDYADSGQGPSVRSEEHANRIGHVPSD